MSHHGVSLPIYVTPYIPLQYCLAAFPGTSNSSRTLNFQLTLIFLRSGEEAERGFVSLVPSYPREVNALSGRDGPEHLLAVQYLAVRGSYDRSEFSIVLPVALVMEPTILFIKAWGLFGGRHFIPTDGSERNTKLLAKED